MCRDRLEEGCLEFGCLDGFIGLEEVQGCFRADCIGFRIYDHFRDCGF